MLGYSAVVNGTNSSGFGDIFSTVKDVAGMYFGDRELKRSYSAQMTPPPTQVVYTEGYDDPNAGGSKKTWTYQQWGIGLAVVGVLVSIFALVRN